MHDITIETIPSRRLAALAHKGPYMNIGAAFEKLLVLSDMQSLLSKGARTAAVYFDDPAAVAPDALRADAGIEIPSDFEVNDPLRLVEIKGGRHAVLHYKGPYAELEKSYNWLYGSWLPHSGEEAADRPAFEIYLNDCRALPPAEWLTDIFLPLANN